MLHTIWLFFIFGRAGRAQAHGGERGTFRPPRSSVVGPCRSESGRWLQLAAAAAESQRKRKHVMGRGGGGGGKRRRKSNWLSS